MEANIYQNEQGEYILEWKTGRMKSPAYNHFRTREEAEEAEKVARLVMDRLKAREG